MKIRSADRSLVDLDLYIVGANFRDRNTAKIQSLICSGLHQGIHESVF